jgi:hypothetical protein
MKGKEEEYEINTRRNSQRKGIGARRNVHIRRKKK